MPDAAILALSWRITRRRIASSPLAAVAVVAFPAFVVWIGLTDSYGTAAKFFFFLLPHVFLVAEQDKLRHPDRFVVGCAFTERAMEGRVVHRPLALESQLRAVRRRGVEQIAPIDRLVEAAVAGNPLSRMKFMATLLHQMVQMVR